MPYPSPHIWNERRVAAISQPHRTWLRGKRARCWLWQRPLGQISGFGLLENQRALLLDAMVSVGASFDETWYTEERLGFAADYRLRASDFPLLANDFLVHKAFDVLLVSSSSQLTLTSDHSQLLVTKFARIELPVFFVSDDILTQADPRGLDQVTAAIRKRTGARTSSRIQGEVRGTHK